MPRRDFTTTGLVPAGFDCTQAPSSLAEGTSNTQTLIQVSAMTHHQILLPPQAETGDAALLDHSVTGSVCFPMEESTGHLTPPCLAVVIPTLLDLKHHQSLFAKAEEMVLKISITDTISYS